MHRERLSRLVEILDAVPPARFDITTWLARTACGTVACAAGWAALDPGFNAEGLRLEGGCPVYRAGFGLAAMGAFFGLNYPTAKNLFLPGGYAGSPAAVRPADVAAKIRDMLETP